MAQDDKALRAIAGIGASAAAAIGILLGADIAPACAVPATAYSQTQSAESRQQLVAVLEGIKASAAELNEILDEVMLAILKDRATVQHLSASRFPLLAETLRSLEQAVRQTDDLGIGTAQRKEFLRALASIRSRVVDITSAIRQSTSVETFDSQINRKGLATLAEHSTRNLYRIVG